MKNNSRDNLREQAEKIGNEMASELDRCATDENLAEIKERISDLIIFRKKRTVKKIDCTCGDFACATAFNWRNYSLPIKSTIG